MIPQLQLLALLSATLLPAVIAANLPSQTPLSEGDRCWSGEEGDWVCKRPSQCWRPSDSRRGLCGDAGTEHVLCCPPPPRTKRAIHTARSYCEKLLGENCGPSTPGWLVEPLENKEEEDGFFHVTVVGGDKAVPGDYPEMALIGFGEEGRKAWLCGGTLISEKFVLSAAHCMRQSTLGPAKWIRVGDTDYSTEDEPADRQDFRIARAIPHPEYSEPQMYHDIVLFELEGAAKFSKYVRPVCLHTSPTVPFSSVVAAGWGRTGQVESVSSWLMEVYLSLYNHSTCIQSRKASRVIPRGIDRALMLCAGWNSGGKDTCQGDSGGPLLLKHEAKCVHIQIGITSFGGFCALPDSAGVYTRVSTYIPWIEKTVWG